MHGGPRQRFEVLAAYALGIALPLLEVARRRTDFSNLPGYVDDFVVGALLFSAARAVTRGLSYGDPLLTAAWGILCGGLWYSVFGQLANPSGTDVSGLSNHAVVAIKLTIYAIALTCLVRTVRHAASRRAAEVEAR